jgi:hypothetical protein
MTSTRMLLVFVYVAMSVLQAWDSDVERAPSPIVALVGAAILAPTLAYVATRDPRLRFGAVALSGALVLVARIVSPIPQGELFMIPWLAFMLLWLERIAETWRRERRPNGA